MKHEKYCANAHRAFLSEWQNRMRMAKARSKADSYVCRRDEIELLLRATLEGLRLSEYNISTIIAIWKCWGDYISIFPQPLFKLSTAKQTNQSFNKISILECVVNFRWP